MKNGWLLRWAFLVEHFYGVFDFLAGGGVFIDSIMGMNTKF